MKMRTAPTRLTVVIEGFSRFGFFEVRGDLVAVWLPGASGRATLEGREPEERAVELVRELVA